MLWPTLCSCLLACLLAGGEPQQQPSSQHGPVKLAWKFKEKDRFTLETNFNQVELRRSGVQLHRDVMVVRVFSSFTVTKVNDEEKSVTLEQKIEDARFQFDGTDRVNAALQADLFGKLAGATFHITLAEDGKVLKFEGYKELIARIQQASPLDVERFKAMVSEESLKNATEEGFGCFPTGEIKNGEIWKRPITVAVPPVGVLKGDLVFTLRGVTKGKAKITSKCDKYEFLPGTNLQGVKCEFALDTRESTMQFDVDKGRLVSSDTTVRYKGKITSAATEGNLPITLLDVEMQQTIKITVKDRSRN